MYNLYNQHILKVLIVIKRCHDLRSVVFLWAPWNPQLAQELRSLQLKQAKLSELQVHFKVEMPGQ
jgi:hypothetical protein